MGITFRNLTVQGSVTTGAGGGGGGGGTSYLVDLYESGKGGVQIRVTDGVSYVSLAIGGTVTFNSETRTVIGSGPSSTNFLNGPFTSGPVVNVDYVLYTPPA